VWRIVSVGWSVCLAVAALGCSFPTEPTKSLNVQFTTPTEGEVLTIGDTVTISWTCGACEDFTYQVFVYTDGFNRGFAVSPHITETSFSWVVGSTIEGVAFAPGSVEIGLKGEGPTREFHHWGLSVRLVEG